MLNDYYPSQDKIIVLLIIIIPFVFMAITYEIFIIFIEKISIVFNDLILLFLTLKDNGKCKLA